MGNESVDTKFKMLLIGILFFLVIVFLIFLSSRPKEETTLDLSLDIESNIKNNNHSLNVLNFSENLTTPFSGNQLSEYTNKLNNTNITCTPYMVEKTLFVERAYNIRINNNNLDFTVYKAVPKIDGYMVKGVSRMSYQGIDAESEMRWYFDNGMKCIRMEMDVPMMGTRAYDECFSYPIGILCREMLEQGAYNSTSIYKISGNEYPIDVYNQNGFEIGIGKDIPILFYTGGMDKNISVKLYYINID